MKFILVCMLLGSTAALSLAVPVQATSNDADVAMLESLSEQLQVGADPAANIEVAAGTLENAQEKAADVSKPKTPPLTRYVRLQSASPSFSVSYIAVYDSDGKVISESKSVTSSCGSCGYPAAPTVIVNGKAEARKHPHSGSTVANPGSWHSSPGLDWIEIDLGSDYPVSKVAFYNRLDCCQERANRAILTLLDSARNVVDSALLNSDQMQIFSFQICDLDINTDSYTAKHSESASPMLRMLCGLQMKIKNSQLAGAKEVAVSKALAIQKKTDVEKARSEFERADSVAAARAKDEANMNQQKETELAMIRAMVTMIHALNGKRFPGTSALDPISDIAQLVGKPSGFYFVKPKNEKDAVKVYVDNDRNGGGWVLAARVTISSCAAHLTRSAVNMKSASEGPTKEDSATVKLADSFIQSLRTSSSAEGTIGFWMEAPGFQKNTFISSLATVDSPAQANEMPQRANLASSYGKTQGLEQMHPNYGTKGFGDHHTSVGRYFAWGRLSDCGFREDNLGRSDGFLWVR